MENNAPTDNAEPLEQRSILIRVIAAIIWLVITLLLVNMIIGFVLGGMAGAEVGAGKLLSEAISAGSTAGEHAAVQFYSKHGGKVFLGEIVLWVVLLVTGKYPWVSKYKASNA